MNLPTGTMQKSVAQSVEYVRNRSRIVPKVGIILGSGLGNFAEHISDAAAIAYSEIPHFPKLSAAGHAGELILGKFADVPIVAMKGRAHLYEGHEPTIATYGVRVLAALGASTLIVSNAAGGLDHRHEVGDIVVIDSHIDLMHRTGLQGSERLNSSSLGIALRGKNVYDDWLLTATKSAASACNVQVPRGTYLATLGPSYETRAEYRAFRTMGADMVGMSTVPETILARSLGLHVLAFSVITNLATFDIQTSTSHDEVLQGAAIAQNKIVAILERLFRDSAVIERMATKVQ